MTNGAAGSSRLSVGTVTLLAVCVLAWAPALLAPGSRFWDDWVILGGGAGGVYHDAGMPWVAVPVQVLVGLGAWSFKVVAVLATMATALAARRVAESGLGFSSAEAWFLAALMTALPLNAARSSVGILLTYTVSLAAFMVAWAMIVTPADGRPRRVTAVGATALFVLSFTTASLLVFLALPVAHLATRYLRPSSPLLPQAGRFVRTYWFLVAAPIAFWIARSLLVKPSGLYAGYNSFVVERRVIPLIAFSTWLLVVGLFALAAPRIARRGAPFADAPRISACAAGITVVVLAVVMFVPRNPHGAASLLVAGLLLVTGALVLTPVARDARVLTPTGMGLIAIGLGYLPYLLVGKVPAFTAWDSRHQLLLPIGAALLVVGAARAAEPAVGPQSARTALIALLGAATLISAANCLALVIDWHKQAQVIEYLRHESVVRRASTVVMIDDTHEWGYDDRTPRFYEYTGWLRDAFGGQSRLGVSATELPAWRAGRNDRLLTDAGRFGVADWNPKGPTVAVRIRASHGGGRWALLLDRPSVQLEVRRIGTPPSG